MPKGNCTECGKPTIGQGLCESHYRRWTRYGQLAPIHPEKGSVNAHLALTDHQLQVLDGEMLGDGCLFRRTPTRNAVLMWNLKSKQHIDALAATFSAYRPTARAIGDTGRSSLVTATNTALTEQRVRWYPDETKHVPADLQLTPLACMYWFLGDGSNRGGGALRFHTEGFAVAEVEHLVALLAGLGFPGGIRFRTYKSGHKLPFVALGARAGRDFLDYIGPCPIGDYAHKWDRRWRYG